MKERDLTEEQAWLEKDLSDAEYNEHEKNLHFLLDKYARKLKLEDLDMVWQYFMDENDYPLSKDVTDAQVKKTLIKYRDHYSEGEFEVKIWNAQSEISECQKTIKKCKKKLKRYRKKRKIKLAKIYSNKKNLFERRCK